jgi:hypothetical protein
MIKNEVYTFGCKFKEFLFGLKVRFRAIFNKIFCRHQISDIMRFIFLDKF